MGVYEVIRVKTLIDEPLREMIKHLNFETKIVDDLIIYNESFNYSPDITIDPFEGVKVKDKKILGIKIKYLNKEYLNKVKDILDSKEIKYNIEIIMIRGDV